MEYITHYEIQNGLLVLVVREFITSNFPVYKRIYFNNNGKETDN